MIAEITNELKAQIMDDKCQHDSLSQAIRLAKNSGLPEKQIKPLMLEKQRYKKICANNVDRLLRAMPLSTNVVQLKDEWYAIRHTNQHADIILKIDVLKGDDAYLLKRDSRHERELSRTEIETLLPGMIDEEALELYKQKLSARAVQLVLEYTGVHLDGISGAVEPDEPIAATEITTVSAHAGKRWVQRIIGIKGDAEAEDYRKLHHLEVSEAILEGYLNAQLVWEEKVDDISYWFDENNIMYVKGRQNGTPNIITVYEEDFGFTKTINRIITLEQLTVLQNAKNGLLMAEDNISSVNSRIEGEIQAINDEISILESKVALLVSQRAEKLTQREQTHKQLRLAKDLYASEFNKLFKKWEI